MGYEYRPEEALPAIQQSIPEFEGFISSVPQLISQLNEVDMQVNEQAFTTTVAAAVGAIRDCETLFKQMLGEDGDTARVGSLFGCMRLAKNDLERQTTSRNYM